MYTNQMSVPCARLIMQVIKTASAVADSTPCPNPCQVASFKPYSFDPSDLEKVQASPLMQPFPVMGSQAVLGPEEASCSHGPVEAPYRHYLWGTAQPENREHSDLIILKQLLTGHQNKAVYSLLKDSWAKARTFYKDYDALKKAQLKVKLAAGQLSGDFDAMLSALEGLDVDMSPLVAKVCGAISSSGEGGQQLQEEMPQLLRQLQERLRSEAQLRQQERLQQVQEELLQMQAKLQAQAEPTQSREQEEVQKGQDELSKKGRLRRVRGELQGTRGQVQTAQGELQ
jgi:septin family protein